MVCGVKVAGIAFIAIVSLAQPPLKRPEIILWVCAQLAMTAVR